MVCVEGGGDSVFHRERGVGELVFSGEICTLLA